MAPFMRWSWLHSIPILLLPFALDGCATLHHAQLDEIDGSRGALRPFEVHVSEMGVNAREAGQLASAVAGSKQPSQVAAIAQLFQFGTKTGDPVFSETFADAIAQAIVEECPSGDVTGLVSLRETTKYYAVSGEYVTVKGYCIDHGKQENARP
jgi:hypothetical protein